MANMNGESQKNPVQELEQNYPGVEFKDFSLNLPENLVASLFRRRQGTQGRFRFRVKVWGWQFVEHGRVNKKTAKRAVAERALRHLKGCVTGLNYDANMIEKMVEKKYDELSARKENAAAIRKVLAAIVLVKKESVRSTMKVVALGTGTKCISSQYMIPGKTVNDCHGEVIAKRAFRNYLYKQLNLCFENHENDSIFQFEPSSGKYILKDGIHFHMYVSTAPCGDARVFMPVGLGVQPDGHTGRSKRGKSRCKIDEGEGSVLAEKHIDSDRLVIMSCSDKMASWNITGVQGALLSMFIKPIFLTSIVVGKNYNHIHMARAMYTRVGAVTQNEGFPEAYKAPVPMVGEASSSTYQQARQSRSHSLNWWDEDTIMAEVIDASTGSTQNGSPSRLCKREMFQKWIGLMEYPLATELLRGSNQFNYTGNESYGDIKRKAIEYHDVKQMLHEHYNECGLGPWIKISEQNDFRIEQ